MTNTYFEAEMGYCMFCSTFPFVKHLMTPQMGPGPQVGTWCCTVDRTAEGCIGLYVQLIHLCTEILYKKWISMFDHCLYCSCCVQKPYELRSRRKSFFCVFSGHFCTDGTCTSLWMTLYPLSEPEFSNLLPLKLLTFLRKLISLPPSTQPGQQSNLLSWQPDDPSLPWGRGHKRTKTQETE